MEKLGNITSYLNEPTLIIPPYTLPYGVHAVKLRVSISITFFYPTNLTSVYLYGEIKIDSVRSFFFAPSYLLTSPLPHMDRPRGLWGCAPL